MITPRRGFYALCWTILLVAFTTVPMPFFTLAPGGAFEVPDLLEVEDADVRDLHGSAALLAVTITSPSLAQLIEARLSDDTEITSRAQLLPEGQQDAEYFDQQRVVFADALTTSAAVAMQAAGLPVTVHSLPSVVQVLPAGPAAGVLQPGDLVTSINGTSVTTADELVARAQTLAEGDPISLELLREEEPVHVDLVAARVGRMTRPGLGITVDTVPRDVELPVDVRLRDDVRISGPSAGLMFAVTIYDLVSPEDLLAGRRVAGTGTLDLDGRVGRIGSIQQKVLAAQRAGFEVFLAPAGQVEEARRAAGSGLEVIGVETFDDALVALREAPDAV